MFGKLRCSLEIMGIRVVRITVILPLVFRSFTEGFCFFGNVVPHIKLDFCCIMLINFVNWKCGFTMVLISKSNPSLIDFFLIPHFCLKWPY